MKIKKLVSAVAALAISVSAFAGWTWNVQAADTVEANLKESVDYTSTTAFESGSNDSWKCTAYSGAQGTIAIDYGKGLKFTAGTANSRRRQYEAQKEFEKHFSGDVTITQQINWSNIIGGNTYAYTGVLGTTPDGKLSHILKIGADGQTGDIYINNTKTETWNTKYNGTNCGYVRLATWDIVINYNTELGNGSYTIVSNDSNDYTLNGTFSSTAEDVAGLMAGNNANNGTSGFGHHLLNYKVYQKDVTANEAKYTINYQLDNETIKTTNGIDTVGKTISIENSFIQNGQKYFVFDSGSTSLVITGDEEKNTLNVPVRIAETYEMKVVSDFESSELASASVVEGDSFTYSYPKYLTDETGKVTASTSNTSFGATITPNTSNTITIPYTAYEGTAYFVEGETLSESFTNQGDNRLSGANAARGINSAKTIFTVSESGIYKITTRAYSNNVNNERNFSLYKNDDLLTTHNLKNNSINKLQDYITDMVVLNSGNVIKIVGGDSQATFDYILIEKTGDIDPAPDTTFTSRADYKYEGDTVGMGSVRFLSEPTWAEADGTPESYGFWFVEAADKIDTTVHALNQSEGDNSLTPGTTFHYTMEGKIGPDTGIHFYAIPWVDFGNNRVATGKAFTFDGTVSTSTEVVNGTIVE